MVFGKGPLQVPLRGPPPRGVGGTLEEALPHLTRAFATPALLPAALSPHVSVHQTARAFAWLPQQRDAPHVCPGAPEPTQGAVPGGDMESEELV